MKIIFIALSIIFFSACSNVEVSGYTESIVKNASDKSRSDKIFAQRHIVDICNKYHIVTPKRDNLICCKGSWKRHKLCMYLGKGS